MAVVLGAAALPMSVRAQNLLEGKAVQVTLEKSPVAADWVASVVFEKATRQDLRLRVEFEVKELPAELGLQGRWRGPVKVSLPALRQDLRCGPAADGVKVFVSAADRVRLAAEPAVVFRIVR